MTQDMEKKRDMRIILSDVCRDRRRMMLEIEEAEARANAQPVYANDEEGEENA